MPAGNHLCGPCNCTRLTGTGHDLSNELLDSAARGSGTARYSTARHSTAWYSIVQPGMARYSMAQHGTVQNGAARHGKAWHGTTWHTIECQSPKTIQCGTARLSTACHGAEAWASLPNLSVSFCSGLQPSRPVIGNDLSPSQPPVSGCSHSVSVAGCGPLKKRPFWYGCMVVHTYLSFMVVYGARIDYAAPGLRGLLVPFGSRSSPILHVGGSVRPAGAADRECTRHTLALGWQCYL